MLDKKKLKILHRLMLFHHQITTNVKSSERKYLIELLFILADVELDKINTLLADMLRGLELRKRAYHVNMPNIVYIIGRKKFERF